MSPPQKALPEQEKNWGKHSMILKFLILFTAFDGTIHKHYTLVEFLFILSMCNVLQNNGSKVPVVILNSIPVAYTNYQEPVNI